jgi:hypothetical protein
MLEHERTHLMPMPEPFDGYMEKPARVSRTRLSVARNRCSVPCELAGQMASTRLYAGRVVVVANDAAVAGHERLSHIRSQTERNASIGAGSRHPRSVARRVDKSKPDRSVHHRLSDRIPSLA